jgi:hypothetical protein
MWRNGECKERGGQCKEKGKCDDKGEQKPYIQFLCTAHLYSTKHSPNSLISSHFDPFTSPFLAHPTSMLEYNVWHLKTQVCKIISNLNSGRQEQNIIVMVHVICIS